MTFHPKFQKSVKKILEETLNPSNKLLREKEKMLQNHLYMDNSRNYTPNWGVEQAPGNLRLRRKCRIPKLKPNVRCAIQTLWENSFQINKPSLFNCIPKNLREIRKHKDEFKFKLDLFLSKIPDEPRMNSLAPKAEWQQDSLTACLPGYRTNEPNIIGLGCPQLDTQCPPPKKNSVYKVMTVIRDDSSLNMQ